MVNKEMHVWELGCALKDIREHLRFFELCVYGQTHVEKMEKCGAKDSETRHDTIFQFCLPSGARID